MCLINELARFNKMQHQYRLTDEAGKATNESLYYLTSVLFSHLHLHSYINFLKLPI